MTKKITWLIVVRLLLVTLFLSVGAIVFKVNRSFFYVLIASVYLLSVIYLVWLLRKKWLMALLSVQLVLDCVLETIIVLHTGSIDSVFTTLYLVTILYASVIVSPTAGMCTTGLVSMAYVGQILLAVNNLVPFVKLSPWAKDAASVVYSAHVHLVTFLLVGILSAVLSRRLHQMEAKVREKERAAVMGELATQIAHEIRNPLATISGSIELLEEELRPQIDVKNRNLMKAVVTESERLSGIFEQFLDFSKLDTLTHEAVSVHDLLAEICMLLENSSSIKNITLVKEFDLPNVTVEADRNRIKQVFWNIIRNALEAMAGSGTLSIRLEDRGSEAGIIFRDSGPGMDKRQLRDLFAPFRSTKKGGVGIGLMIAHKIVEKHGGTITVHSKRKKGSTFIVTIPKQRRE